MKDTIRDQVRSVLRDKLMGNNSVELKKLISDTLEIDPSTIRKWIAPNSNSIPSTVDLPIICDLLNITLAELFGLNQDELNVKQKQLLKSYEDADDKNKTLVDTILDIK
ncbi:MAG: hypothetical protein R3Y60_01555 [bacterium]